jgi:hypothetical protein
MTEEQVVEELIALRRSLPSPASDAAELGRDPAEGMRLGIPGDADWWIQVLPGQHGWRVIEVHSPPPPMPPLERALGEAGPGADEVLTLVDAQYRRLLLERRNAACGTPIR